MNKALRKKVKNVFKTRFGSKPLMVFSPGRINLIGEHTDYNEGFVFPAAINKGIALAINKNNTEKCRVYALDKSEVYVFALSHIAPLEKGGWRNYVLGVLAELQKRKLKLGAFDAVFAGDIPSGSGMSSSAALENSFVFGLNSLFSLGLTKLEMILISQQAEHNFAGVKCGIMDQYASMFGVDNSALMLDCRRVTSEPFKIDFGDYGLMLINTNVKHALSESAYNDRRDVCEKVADIMGVKALRDASLKDLEGVKNQITEAEFHKAQYIIEENNRVQQFSEAIIEDNLLGLGQLLYQSHDGLSNKYDVSCEELDFLVAQTKKHEAILGARMMGGGFGGCTISLINKSSFKAYKKLITKAYKEEFGSECSIYKVKLSDGTRIV